MQLKLEVFRPPASCFSLNVGWSWTLVLERATQAKNSLTISVIEYCFMYFCCKTQLFGDYIFKNSILASYKNGIKFHRWWWCWLIHFSSLHPHVHAKKITIFCYNFPIKESQEVAYSFPVLLPKISKFVAYLIERNFCITYLLDGP